MNPLPPDLNDLYLFTQVVERSGFTAAGDALDIPKSRLSRRISQLEANLGVRLLQRTSRRLSLTLAGQEFYVHCRAMVVEAFAATEALRKLGSEPVGVVRVSAPLAITDMVLATLLPRFMVKYPKVQLNLMSTDRRVDLLDENIDVVVRGVSNNEVSSSLVQVPLCSAGWGLLASPSYLRTIPAIEGLEHLQAAEVLLHGSINEGEFAKLTGPDKQVVNCAVRARVQSDNTLVLKHAALAGVGIATLPMYSCTREMAAGELVQVLPGWHAKAGQLVALFPSRRGLLPSVRAFVDFMKEELPALVH